MPSIAIAVTAKDWTRIKPALRSAYGPVLDPESQLSDDTLALRAVRHHVQQIVKDYERSQAEAAILVSDLD